MSFAFLLFLLLYFLRYLSSRFPSDGWYPSGNWSTWTRAAEVWSSSRSLRSSLIEAEIALLLPRTYCASLGSRFLPQKLLASSSICGLVVKIYEKRECRSCRSSSLHSNQSATPQSYLKNEYYGRSLTPSTWRRSIGSTLIAKDETRIAKYKTNLWRIMVASSFLCKDLLRSFKDDGKNMCVNRNTYNVRGKDLYWLLALATASTITCTARYYDWNRGSSCDGAEWST